MPVSMDEKSFNRGVRDVLSFKYLFLAFRMIARKMRA